MTWRRFLVALGVLSLSAPVGAQYFGRNKVQYDRFDFHILQTPHFDVYYYESERDAVQIAAQLAERWYTRLSDELDHKFKRRQPIILYASHSHFAQTSVIAESIPEGVGGFTDGLAGRVVLPFAAGLGETDHVLGHEIVHAFQREILREGGRSLGMVPLWFAEGMAEYLSVRELDVNTKMWLRDAAENGRLPTIAQLDDPKFFPYRYGQALWVFLAHDYGEATVVKALKSRARGGAVGRLRDATGKDGATLSQEWHEFIKKACGAADKPADVVLPTRVIGFEQNGGRMNVAPAISPDGRRIVFLSERDGYSVDVFVADASTGVVERKLLSTAADAHFDSLQFIDSAGAWDATGRSFVLATLRDGRAALTVFDMVEGTLRRELPVTSVDQIFSPTWSPDGRQIAFSALKGGVTDLFVVDVATGKLRQLTADSYSDLQPSWSPDGERLVFATDRYSSSLTTLSFGHYQLATLDIGDGTVHLLGGLPRAKNVDPHWSADGESVYFVSDADGTSNVYRLDARTSRTTRVTLVRTGVSGITALSPAISISAKTGRLAMSLYMKGMYEIRTLALDTRNATTETQPSELTAESGQAGPSQVEPGQGEPGQAKPAGAAESETVENAQDGSPSTSDSINHDAPVSDTETHPGAPDLFPSKRYVPRLSIAQLGTPYLSAGGGAFGTFVRAGVSVGFGDMLGQQELDLAIQGGKQLYDDAAVASYMNRRSRWNWGVSGGFIPALVGTTDVTTRTTDASGRDVYVQQTGLLQQIHRQAAGMVAYPFNRAERLEASLGVDMIAYQAQTTTTVSSAATGFTLSNNTANTTAAQSATMIQSGVALVHDTAVFGPASPVLGERYRFAFAPSFGDLRVLTTVADFRRYFMPVRPFTIAIRGDAVARTGPNAADGRLLPLIWNMPDMVRGFYTDNDTIRTSRFAVANVELRTPLASLLHHNTTSYGALPIELLTFADCGRFWIPTAAVESAPLNARTLCGAGAGARINAAGFIFELDAVRPYGPTANGWRLGVNFQPGF